MSKEKGDSLDDWHVSDTPEERLQDWKTGWDKGYWDFFYTEPGKVLAEHFEKVTGGRKGLKILVPLSATSYDLIWLCNLGHTVVGTDLADSAAERVFKQYKQKPIIENVPSINGKLYKNASGTFKYYVGDFFLFSEQLEGKFDFIWDTGAMCAVDKRDRNKYLKVIRNIMKPKCTLMLEFPKENSPEGRAPFTFTKEELEGLYGDICNVELLGESTFDFGKTFYGAIDDDGNPVIDKGQEKKQENPTQAASQENEEEKLVSSLICYCLKKRE